MIEDPALSNMSNILANSKWDVLKNFMQGLPFTKQDISLVNKTLDFNKA